MNIMARREQRLPEGLTSRHRSRGFVAGLLALGLFLGGCTVSTNHPGTETKTLSPGAFSTLDAAGVEQIRASKTARLDMSSGTLQKAAVNLEPTKDYGPEINTRDSSKINLTIVGPSGEINGETDRIRFNTFHTRSDFSEVTYFLTTTSRDEYYGYIRDGVQRYGIDADAAERWITSNEKEPGSRSDYSLPSGTDTGLSVNYDLRYDGTKEIQVIIVHVRPAA